MTRSRRAARTVVVVLALPLLCLLVAGPALAEGELVRGTLRFEGEPVEGVTITARTADGDEVGTDTSGEDGTWEIVVDQPGRYLVELDPDTLPEDVGLRDPDRNPLEFELTPGQNRTLIFALGEGAGGGASFIDSFLATTVNGLQFGLIIAITAVGLSLVFGTTGLVNFAHGDLVTLGAVLAWFLNSPDHLGGKLHIIVAATIAVALSAAFGGALELGLWRPLRRRRTGLIQMLVISIGLALVLRNLIQIAFGGRSLQYLDYNLQEASIVFGPIAMTPRDVWLIALALAALVGTATMLQRTRIGKAMRAVSDNRDLAESSGIDVQRVVLLVWVIGTGLAAFGGILAGLDENVSFLLGFRLLLLMFAGVILGGLGTAYGAMVGSIVVGLVTEWSTLFFATELKITWGLVVLIVILLFRPQGILGQRERLG